MAIDLLMEHPDYPERMRKHRLDLGEAAGDDLKTAQLQAAFEQDKTRMMGEAFANRTTKAQLDAAKTVAATKYPDVDPELYADAATDADVERIAAKVQAAITARSAGAPQAGEGEQGGQTWGGPPAASSSGAPAQAPPRTREQEMDELRPFLAQGRKAKPQVQRYAQLAAAPWIDVLEQRIRESRPQERANQ